VIQNTVDDILLYVIAAPEYNDDGKAFRYQFQYRLC